MAPTGAGAELAPEPAATGGEATPEPAATGGEATPETAAGGEAPAEPETAARAPGALEPTPAAPEPAVDDTAVVTGFTGASLLAPAAEPRDRDDQKDSLGGAKGSVLKSEEKEGNVTPPL